MTNDSFNNECCDIRLSKTPKSLDVAITTNCNLRCSYCSHFSSENDVKTDLPTSEWLKFFKELGENSVMDVCLSGGEALYRKDFKEIVNGIIENRMRFSILSNGTLMTQDMVNFLASSKRCNSIQVSLDGPSPEFHDIMRGTGSFYKALEAIRMLKAANISTTVRVTIHKHNYKKLADVAKLLLEDVKLNSFSTNSASHFGLCVKNSDSIELSVQEYSEAMASLVELNKKYNNRIQAQAGPLASARHWRKMEDSFNKKAESLENCGFLRSCGGVFSKMAVRADGVMIPCSQMPHIELGRINKDSLKTVWRNHPEMKKLRERRNTKLNKFDRCKDCAYVNYCRGGCPALAYAFSGNENVPSVDDCYRMFKEQGGKLPTCN